MHPDDGTRRGGSADNIFNIDEIAFSVGENAVAVAVLTNVNGEEEHRQAACAGSEAGGSCGTTGSNTTSRDAIVRDTAAGRA